MYMFTWPSTKKQLSITIRTRQIMKNIILAALSASLFACASSPDEIPAAYVSPLKYNKHDCEMLTQEMTSISGHVSQLKGTIQDKSDNDEGAMAIGMILFWPALFALDGDGPEAQEYARLKGEFHAIEKSMIQKKCDMTLVDRSVIYEGGQKALNTPAQTDDQTGPKDESSYPKKLTADEINAQFQPHRSFFFDRVPRSKFTLKIHSSNNVERECTMCNTQTGYGVMTLNAQQDQVCFDWDDMSYPSSTCFNVKQIEDNRYQLIDPVNGETYGYKVPS